MVYIYAEKKIPESIVASLTHDIFINGCQINFEIDGTNDVEVSILHPHESFRTMDECFHEFLLKMEKNKNIEHQNSAANHVD